MLIETVELGLPHVGLGALGEPALLALFATAQAHALTAGTGHALDGVTDAAGAALYPGYLWLHLRVPPSRPLSAHRLWSKVSVGVDVERFGRMVLDSTYVLGAEGEVPPAREAWELDRLPSMRATSMFVLDGQRGDAVPAAARDGALAPLPLLRSGPTALDRFREMRAQGTFGRAPWRFSTPAPVAYPLVVGRDVAPGRNLMFATYVAIMDAVEASLLAGGGGFPPLPAAVSQSLSPLEREVFFLGHTGLDESGAPRTVLVEARARIVRCAPNLHGGARDVVSAGVLEVRHELYEAGSHALLTVGRARKLVLLPRARGQLVGDLEKFLEPPEAAPEPGAQP